MSTRRPFLQVPGRTHVPYRILQAMAAPDHLHSIDQLPCVHGRCKRTTLIATHTFYLINAHCLIIEPGDIIGLA